MTSEANALATVDPEAPRVLHKNLAMALAAAQTFARAVHKGSRNTHHGYKYASAEAIIEEAREALVQAGLVVMPSSWRVERGINSMHVIYRVMYPLTGEVLDCPTETSILPERGRPQDKAEATALTYSLGYFLRGLLLLPRVDEEHDVDRRDDTREKRAPAPPRSDPSIQDAEYTDAPPNEGAASPEEREALSKARRNFGALQAALRSEALEEVERAYKQAVAMAMHYEQREKVLRGETLAAIVAQTGALGQSLAKHRDMLRARASVQ